MFKRWMFFEPRAESCVWVWRSEFLFVRSDPCVSVRWEEQGFQHPALKYFILEQSILAIARQFSGLVQSLWSGFLAVWIFYLDGQGFAD